jgi:MFS family permease
LLVTIINGAGLPARALLPVFVDRLGPLNMMAPLALTISVISFCWLAATTSAGIYAFSVLYGLATGAFLALMPTTLASITHRLDMVGTRIGTAFTIISVAALTGPPIGGQLQSTGGGRFTWAQTWSAMAFVACTASLLTARLLHVGWNLKKRA